MRSPCQPVLLWPQGMLTAGAVPWGALWVRGPAFLQLSADHPSLLGFRESRCVPVPGGTSSSCSGPAESHWGTASPIPHVGREAEDESLELKS